MQDVGVKKISAPSGAAKASFPFLSYVEIGSLGFLREFFPYPNQALLQVTPSYRADRMASYAQALGYVIR
jgi:hypothetical protein